MPRPPSKRAKRAEPSKDQDRSSCSESEEESFSNSESDAQDGEESSEEVTTYLALSLPPGI